MGPIKRMIRADIESLRKSRILHKQRYLPPPPPPFPPCPQEKDQKDTLRELNFSRGEVKHHDPPCHIFGDVDIRVQFLHLFRVTVHLPDISTRE